MVMARPEEHRDDDMPRDKLTQAERLSLLERDTRAVARMVSGIVDSSKVFSPAQMAQLQLVLREEFSSVGLRIDDPDHIDLARRDFQFLRALRGGVNGLASKIGWVFIAALCGALVWLVNAGLTFWKGH